MFSQEKHINAQQKAHAFHGLAKSYLKSGEVFLALYAQISSDISNLDSILYKNYEEGYVNELKKIIATRISEIDFESNDAEHMVVQVRREISESIDLNIDTEWNNSLHDSSFLKNNLIDEVESKLIELKNSRLENSSLEEFIADKRNSQAQNLEKANKFFDEGENWSAIESCYNADLDGFEAWLLQRSITLGDTNLIQCELLWALACATLEQMGSLPTEPISALNLERSRLAWVAGPEEALGLSKILSHPKYSKF